MRYYFFFLIVNAIALIPTLFQYHPCYTGGPNRGATALVIIEASISLVFNASATPVLREQKIRHTVPARYPRNESICG